MKWDQPFDVRVSVDLHDIWIGAYWKHEVVEWALPTALQAYGKRKFRHLTTIYICPLPCLVVRIRIQGKEAGLDATR